MKKMKKEGTYSQPKKEKMMNDPQRDEFFLSGHTNDLAVLSLYYASQLAVIVEELLHGNRGGSISNSTEKSASGNVNHNTFIITNEYYNY